MIRRPPRSTLSSSSAASDVYKRQERDIQELVQWPFDLDVHGFLERPVDLGVEDDAAGRGQDDVVLPAILDRLLQRHLLGVERELDLFLVLEALRPRIEIFGLAVR